MAVPSVTVSVEPELDGDLVYLKVAPTSAARAGRGTMGHRLWVAARPHFRTRRRAGTSTILALTAAMLLLPAIAPTPAEAAISGQVKWSVVLCEFSDNAAHNGPITDLNTPQGAADFLVNRGTGGAADYWDAVSMGRINFSGSDVRGWYRMSTTLANDPNISRTQRVQDCLNTAKLNGYEPPAGNRIIVLRNQCADGGADAFNRVLIDPCSPLTFAAHEMGHAFGLNHSFSDNPLYGNSGEYDDEWDVMSAMHVFTESIPRWVSRPVGLNGYHLNKLGWISPGRVVTSGGDGVPVANLTLAPLYGDSSSTPQLVRIPTGDPGRYYTVEYRRPQGLDRLIPSASVQIHEVREGEGHSFLLRKDNNFSPTQQLVVNGKTIVRVLSAGGPTATIEVTTHFVPNVVNMSSSKATDTLRGAGYQVVRSYQVDPSCVYTNRVLSQNPSAGALWPGSTVTITIGTLPQECL